MYTILICDDNLNWLESLNIAIDKDPKFKVVAQAYSGGTTLKLVEKFRPDIIILDIVMPEYDGVYIVNYIRKNMKGYSPIIYILSGLGTDPIVRTLNELYVDFYSMKPVAISIIMGNINMLIKNRDNLGIISAPAEENEGNKENMKAEILKDVIKNLLLRFGIMPHRISSKCVMSALVMYTNSHESFSTLTKGLYPQIAEEYGLSDLSVEKNIRNAISQIQRNKTETCVVQGIYQNKV